LGEDEANLLETWNCFKEGLLGELLAATWMTLILLTVSII
jgi:hypothetical protein